MSALELIKKLYQGTEISSEFTKRIKNNSSANMLDCNCIDCGSDANCSTID